MDQAVLRKTANGIMLHLTITDQNGLVLKCLETTMQKFTEVDRNNLIRAIIEVSARVCVAPEDAKSLLDHLARFPLA